ncbi:hypothetical protein HMPREF3198_00344 [Winkia neuii]|nr:hypothetical protein HMPREF3198_00344 [Winkia neuii]
MGRVFALAFGVNIWLRYKYGHLRHAGRSARKYLPASCAGQFTSVGLALPKVYGSHYFARPESL